MDENGRPSPEKSRAYPTRADTDGELDWRKVMRLSWRPAWSIRSRKGSLAPFLDMIRDLRRSRHNG